MECDGPTSYPYWTEWSDSQLISIIDDSLAVVEIYKHKMACFQYRGDEPSEYKDVSRTGLFLVNYRTQQEPLLGSTFDTKGELKILRGNLKDSSVLVLADNNKFGFWKIGEKSIKFKNHNKMGSDFYVANANNWINGNIMLQSHTNRYILNKEKGRIEFFDPANKHECMFMQDGKRYNGYLYYIGDKEVCVRENTASIPNYSELIVDGVVVDTTNDLLSVYDRFGNYIMQNSKGKVFKVDAKSFKFDKKFKLWIDGVKFYNDKDNYPYGFVRYSTEDLIGAIND
jgi:hypothetical protein